MASEAPDKTGESLDGTEERVVVGSMSYSLTADSILLVSEFEGCVVEMGHVIQRCCSGGVGHAVASEVDMSQQEGLAAAFLVAGKVLRRAEEPVEGDDDEVDDMGVEAPEFGVVGVQGVGERADNGKVDRVAA